MGIPKSQEILPFPKEGEEFELTLDGDTPDPFQMVRSEGFDPTEWKFNGPKIEGRQTKKFKLLRAGVQPNYDAV